MNEHWKRYAMKKKKNNLSQKTIVYDSPYIKCPVIGTPIETEHRVVVARHWGREGLELIGKD